MNDPIISSILDTDVYKLHMQQAVWHLYPQAQVTLEFECRNNEDLLPYLDEIKAEINQLQWLAITDSEIEYLASLGFYKADYLDYLSRFRFDPKQVRITTANQRLNISIDGPWHQVILWEIPILEIISEVRNRRLYPLKGIEQAIKPLQAKIEQLKKSEFTDFKLIEFGSRRRFSHQVQQFVLTQLAEQVPQHLVGTSNYLFAKQLGLTPIGTQAHEWFQGHQRLSSDLRQSQTMALQAWLSEYPQTLGIALTDCISMDAFLADFDLALAQQYSGVRQDSGDPIVWGEKAIAHYQQLGIDAQQQKLIFSDGLDINKALAIYQHFQGKAQISFGIGTNLTCDLEGVVPMNIVLKMTQCNGLPVAKISDSPGKTMCRDPEYIQLLKQAYQLPL